MKALFFTSFLLYLTVVHSQMFQGPRGNPNTQQMMSNNNAQSSAPTANVQSATNSPTPTTTDWCSQCYAYQHTNPDDLNNVVSMCCPTNNEDYTSCVTGCMFDWNRGNHGALSKKIGIQECFSCLFSCKNQARLSDQVTNCAISYFDAS